VTMQLIDCQWGRLRPGVTVLRDDGRLERAATVEHRDDTTLVWFDDGRLERHDDSDRAQVLTRAREPVHRDPAEPSR
jgi:hypothetical protein